MSISAAMYAAVTGLQALSTGMQVISNNIANVNTVGFKAARTNFEDLISQDYMSNGRIQQIGRGVKVSTVQQMFTQGAFINSAQDTDMAIAGEGFFTVRDRFTGDILYTRAGDFTLDKDGFLETQSGYVLQGWEMSIPKPGADPVIPTDVKVIVLNAPPLETSQIKVVVNLNADDVNAYGFSSAEFAEQYAFQVADGPAQAAWKIAADAVYSSDDGIGYLNNSQAFNQAYETFMEGQGYNYTAGKWIGIENPSAPQKIAAENFASASAWDHLQITDPNIPITAIPPSYATAYNNFYVDYMVNTLGFTEGPPYVFTKTATLVSPADQTQAVLVGIEAARTIPGGNSNYTAYGDGPAVSDDAYVDAYTAYLVGIGYVEPPAKFLTMAPTGTVRDNATTSAATAVYPGYTYPQTGATSANLTYLAAYALRMKASGYTLSTAFFPTTFPLPTLNITQLMSDAGTAASVAAISVDPGFDDYDPTVDSLSASLTFLEGFMKAMPDTVVSASATSQFFGTSWFPSVAVINSIITTLSVPYRATVLAAASGAAVAAGADTLTYTYPSGNFRHDVAYLAGLERSLTTFSSSLGISKNDLPAHPVEGDFVIRQAVMDGANLAGFSPGTGNYQYPSTATPPDRASELAYLAGWARYLDSRGIGVQDDYPLPNVIPGGVYVMKAVDATEEQLANQAGITATGDPLYTFPSPSGDAVKDQAYRDGYEGYFTNGGTSEPNFSGFATKTPTTPQIDEAKDYASGKAHEEMGPFEGYPLDGSQDATFAAWYTEAYEDYMVDTLHFVKISTPPFFESATTSAALEATAALTAETMAKLQAATAGKAAYDLVFDPLYAAALAEVKAQYAGKEWMLEGMGFAGAWNGTDLTSPIDPENYTHANPWTIYDSLGTAHTLMVYYQPDPYEENVWDYIITCDPTEDARKDANKTLFMSGATFAGLIQKGKITFTADGPDGHGGLIKDIEAQNIDYASGKTAIARLSSASAHPVDPDLVKIASSITHYDFGGYFNASPVASAAAGMYVATNREYTITWAGNLPRVPVVSGFTWVDNAGNSESIPVADKSYGGPYPFGSGLTIDFSDAGTALNFTVGDSVTVVAHSEAIAWKEIQTNTEGYYDFDVAFVQSASMATHPPYPPGLPTIVQHISLDMGARAQLPGNAISPWILDEQSTTQYASKSVNIFSSQDGYPPGSLQRISIDANGVLTGIYTNGRHQALYQIGLTRFINPWGLAKLGDNVYMETRWSGTGVLNEPGTNGNGTIRANFLEQSNTDIADEIVNMIVTQRGFQANSKVVTTTDTMLAEVIEMKR